MRSRIILLLLACALLGPTASAQKNSWSNLSKLHRGWKIQVVETDLKSSIGKFVRFSDAELVFEVNHQEMTVPRERVYRVSEYGTRGRNALYGALAGAGLGALAAAVTPSIDDITGKSENYPILMGFGGAVGAGIGAAVPPRPTVYRAEAPAARK